MASVPIRSTAVVAAPKDYPIPPSQEIILQSVRASFLDNGAGGDWVPALQILDNNGNVLVTAADKGVTVTAGDDADVSWFPGVKVAAAASASSAVSYATGWRDDGRGDPNLTIANGASVHIPFLHVATSNAAVMLWQTTANPNDQLALIAPGLYALAFSGSMTVGETWQLAIVGNSFDDLQHTGFPNGSVAGAHNPPHGIGTHQDYTWVLTTAGTSVRFWVENLTGFDRITDAYYATATYFGVPA